MSVAVSRDAELGALVECASLGERHAVARLVSLFQDRRADASHRRDHALALLDRHEAGAEAVVIGITGSPGSGKSSLLGRLATELLRADAELTIAVLAIDPSSPISGGALLGDRTRMQTRADPRLFFRSEAADAELGGLSPSSFQVSRLLSRLFDCVIVETVGIGQSEADIRKLADRVYLVLAPLGGDEVQLMKAGIIEIPDAFVVNKSDEPTAARSYRQLQANLWLARPFDADTVPVFRTSAKTGEGVRELSDAIAAQLAAGPVLDAGARESYFFERWVKEEWGRNGLVHLRSRLGGAAAAIEHSGGFDGAQRVFVTSFEAALGD